MDKITVKVEEVTGKLILHESVANGSYGNLQYNLSAGLPDHSPIITVGEKKYRVHVIDIVKALLEKHEEG